MNIHEYQAKELLAKYGVPVPAGYAGDERRRSGRGREEASRTLWVVKAQIHAGGRGKGKFKELGDWPRAASASPIRSTKCASMRPRCSARLW